ncbi:MAG: bifunctional diaminohydroxyphosphoribosylaminopyrimidine deaminase/5-amino-6-(5-phosphoribosylamino)uracil reductase RibD [Porphyromonas sp.]|nr:bifunctional diaminohydroxyphosphoribosylaminopyrimidine deaminase/5-amino-6-(5-phosphoribosylamino)uracil reductase RibD [Porphyromonas sp.]
MNLTSDKQSMYMLRAVEIAERAEWNDVKDNPKVGAVLVYNDTIIGEGYHQYSGGPHAEVICIGSVAEQNKTLIPESTLYVTLEPCCHHGKTPPCSRLIIDSGIRHVVIGVRDPFPKVQGGGIEQLISHGIRVDIDVEKEACTHLALPFFVRQLKKRPYVALKWAESSDGFIDNRTSDAAAYSSPCKISTPFTSMLVHKMRADFEAILIGKDTFLKDSPRLDLRLWHGKEPHKLVWSRDANLFDNQPEHFSSKRNMWSLFSADTDSLPSRIEALYAQNGIRSLLVEGGQKVLEAFIKADLWDEIRIEASNIRLEKGVSSPQILHLNKERKEERLLEKIKEIDGHKITHIIRLTL